MTKIDLYSYATVPVEQFFDNTAIGKATAFIWEVDGQFFLVTNWHVMTRRHFPTGRNLGCDGARPNKFQLLLNFPGPDFKKQPCEVHIRDAEGHPKWLVHPSRNTDVAVLPLQIDPAVVFDPRAINQLPSINLRLGIGMDVFVLGYPFGSDPRSFPVWKRGSIASEPHLATRTTDYLLVDTASRPGMSGAPVIRRSWGFHILDDGSNLGGVPFATRFVGIYSGRLHTKDSRDAQIGMVWPAWIIEEIIRGGRVDIDW
jgi:hypothetical protein